MPMKPVCVRLPSPLIEKIDAIAVHHQCRPSAAMRHILQIGADALIDQIPPSPRRY